MSTKVTKPNPHDRARLVGREIKKDKRLDLFAATPPLESLRLLCSLCASKQQRHEHFRLMAIDVKRAYFYVKARRAVFIEIPAEDREEGDEQLVGKLNLSLYGTRDAAQNWTLEYTTYLESIGFTKGLPTPCNFKHKHKEIYVTVQGRFHNSCEHDGPRVDEKEDGGAL